MLLRSPFAAEKLLHQCATFIGQYAADHFRLGVHRFGRENGKAALGVGGNTVDT